MASVLRYHFRDKRRIPNRKETELVRESSETAESRIHRPNSVGCKSKVVDVEITGVIAHPRQVKGVISFYAIREEVLSEQGSVGEKCDGMPCGESQSRGFAGSRGWRGSEAHGLVEV